jgi:carbonic anhydrase/acetyltransferase-like protein (isoleucine patch superfamily)
MKYKLRKDLSLDLGRKILYRIERLSDSQLGGYIESENNLSQEGDCWVSRNARVYGNASVYGNAQVYGDAWICGDARVHENAQVYGNARVYGDAQAYENTVVSENAWVYGDARVHGNARVFGSTSVYGNTRVSGDARVSGEAQVCGDVRASNPDHIVNFILPFKYNITVTPDNIAIGCKVRSRKEWLKVTVAEAKEMGLPEDLYELYRSYVKLGLKTVPSRVKLNKLEKEGVK